MKDLQWLEKARQNEPDARACMRLWQAVFGNAIADLTCGYVHVMNSTDGAIKRFQGKKFDEELLYHARCAHVWFFYPNEDFFRVCEMLGISPKNARKAAACMLEACSEHIPEKIQ